MGRWVIVYAWLLWGCLRIEPKTVSCDDGRVCPEKLVCIPGGCAAPDQLSACTDLPDGTACSSASVLDGLCAAGVCSELRCGDGIKAASELCDPFAPGADSQSVCLDRGFHDEGVAVPCASDCTWDTRDCRLYCGDGIITAPYEVCESTAPAGSCIDYGFDRGLLGCDPGLCVPAFEGCDFIGWRTEITNVSSFADAFALGDVLYVAAMVPGMTQSQGAILRYDGAWTEVGTFPALLVPRGVFALAGDDIWAVGTHGASGQLGKGFVAHWDGTSWTLVVELDPEGAFDVWGTGPTEIFVHFFGEIRRYDGSQWTTATLPTQTADARFWGVGSTVYVAGPGTIGLRSYSGGAWMPVAAPFTTAFRISGVSASELYVLAADPTEGDQLEAYRFDGAQWDDLELPPDSMGFIESSVLGMWAAGPSSLVVAARRENPGLGRIRLYHHDGTLWREISDELVPQQFVLLAATSATQIMALTSAAVYHWRHSAWTRRSIASTSRIDDLWAADDRDAYVTTQLGELFRFDGTTWTLVAGVTAYRLGGSASNNVYAYDYDTDRLSHFNGVSWSDVVLPGGVVNDNAIEVRAADDVYLVADNKLLAWNGATLADTGIGSAVNSVSCNAGRCAALTSAGVYLSPSVGTWTALSAPPFGQLAAIWISPDGTVFVSSAFGAFARHQSGSWELLASPVATILDLIDGTSSTDVFASSSSTRTLLRFDGSTWTPVRLPAANTFFRRVRATSKTVYFGGFDVATNSPVALQLDRVLPW